MDLEEREQLCRDGAFSIQEAADFLRLSRAEVYRLMSEGELHYVQHGRRRLVPRVAAVRVLAAGLRGGERLAS